MPLHLIEKPSTQTVNVLLAFGKDNLDKHLFEKVSGLKYIPDITLGAKDITSFYHPENKNKIFVLGLGDIKEVNKSYLYFRSFIHQNKSKSPFKVEVLCDHLNDDQLFNAVLGLQLGMFNVGVFKTNGNSITEPDIYMVAKKERHQLIKTAIITAETQMSIMHLVDHPSNIKTPEYIGAFAKASGKKYNYNVDVFDREHLKTLGMDALLSVGQGSANPPVFIVMEYKPQGSKSKNPVLGLVGKGVSFDTGGISIKPSTNMAYMKCDMAGAAAVIGAIELAAKLALNVHIVGVVPAAENSVDALAIRPGDVIGSYSKKTIEVLDTDAEGRLVLADGLAYIIKNHQPKYLIDLATLTGSCVVTLGYHAAGLFTHNDDMANALSIAGQKVSERVWRLPLWDDYAVEMNSDIADIKNLSGKPVAGAITAAKFLEFFTSEHQQWTHLDIAGVAYTDSEFAKSRTATAFGVRLLVEFMKQIAD